MKKALFINTLAAAADSCTKAYAALEVCANAYRDAVDKKADFETVTKARSAYLSAKRLYTEAIRGDFFARVLYASDWNGDDNCNRFDSYVKLYLEGVTYDNITAVTEKDSTISVKKGTKKMRFKISADIVAWLIPKIRDEYNALMRTTELYIKCARGTAPEGEKASKTDVKKALDILLKAINPDYSAMTRHATDFILLFKEANGFCRTRTVEPEKILWTICGVIANIHGREWKDAEGEIIA